MKHTCRNYETIVHSLLISSSQEESQFFSQLKLYIAPTEFPETTKNRSIKRKYANNSMLYNTLKIVIKQMKLQKNSFLYIFVGKKYYKVKL
jgi:hypothetical protein